MLSQQMKANILRNHALFSRRRLLSRHLLSTSSSSASHPFTSALVTALVWTLVTLSASRRRRKLLCSRIHTPAASTAPSSTHAATRQPATLSLASSALNADSLTLSVLCSRLCESTPATECPTTSW
jgi:hypothetical protein